MSKVRADDLIHIGYNLRKLREKKGYTQADVVRKLQLQGHKVMKQNYSRYEREEEHIPASVLVNLCSILDTTLDDIFKPMQESSQEVDREKASINLSENYTD